MPKKVAELLMELAKNGYVNRGGRGSHRNYEHASGYRVTVAVHHGEAKRYQERSVEEAVKAAQRWAIEHEKH